MKIQLNPGWLERTEFARLLGITSGGFDKRWRPHAGRTEKRGRTVWYHVRELLDNLIAFEVEKASEKAGDGMMAEVGSSPGLERFRLARAAREEIKLRLENRTAIDREEMLAGLLRHVNALRGGLEILRREHPAAFEIMADVLDEWDRGVTGCLQEDTNEAK